VNRLHEAKRHGLLVDYRGILKDLERSTRGGYALADIEGLYQPFSTEYQRLPGLHQALWALFAEVKNRGDREQLRQVLMTRSGQDDEGRGDDMRQMLRDGFDEALTAFALCLQVALSSRSFFEDPGFSEDQRRLYQEDLRAFTDLRRIVRREAQETLDDSPCEEQIGRLAGKQESGIQVREPDGAYLVHTPGEAQDPGVPDAFEGNADARTWFVICRRVMGAQAIAGTQAAQWVALAFAIDAVVRHAVAEHSLHPQNVESAIRQALLPRLFGAMGLDKAREAIEQVIQLTCLGPSRGSP
jgi:hypothetical protein